MSNEALEIVCGWDGEALIPLRGWRKTADANLVIGERYIVSLIEPRSMNSHRFYFAVLGSAYKNLPEPLALQFASLDHFRRRGLIETGWRDQREFVAGNKAEALRLAVFLRSADDYAMISVRGNVIVEWRAKSQSQRAMGREDFEKSKNDVLAWASDMIGVAPEQLQAQKRLPTRSPALLTGDTPPFAGVGSAAAGHSGAVEARRPVVATLDANRASPGQARSRTRGSAR